MPALERLFLLEIDYHRMLRCAARDVIAARDSLISRLRLWPESE